MITQIQAYIMCRCTSPDDDNFLPDMFLRSLEPPRVHDLARERILHHATPQRVLVANPSIDNGNRTHRPLHARHPHDSTTQTHRHHQMLDVFKFSYGPIGA